MFGKIVWVFWYDQYSLSLSIKGKKGHTLTPCECVFFFVIIHYMWCGPLRCAKQEWVFFEANWVTLMEWIVVGEYLWNFVSTLLISFTLRALWKSLCIDSSGGFITLVLSKTNKIASLNCIIVDPSFLPTYLPTYVLIWLKATTTLILIFCTNVNKNQKIFYLQKIRGFFKNILFFDMKSPKLIN